MGVNKSNLCIARQLSVKNSNKLRILSFVNIPKDRDIDSFGADSCEPIKVKLTHAAKCRHNYIPYSLHYRRRHPCGIMHQRFEK